jgi:surface protein
VLTCASELSVEYALLYDNTCAFNDDSFVTSDDMNAHISNDGSENLLSSANSPLTAPPLTAPIIEIFLDTKMEKPSEASSHPAEPSGVSNTNSSNPDHPSSRSSALGDAHAPSSNANDESRLPFETASHMNNPRNNINTKSRFRARAAGAILPGAIAMSPRNIFTNSIGTDSAASMSSGEQNLQDEIDNPFIHYEEYYTNNLESNALVNFVGDEDVTPCIVTAEVVTDEVSLAGNERRRIVEETIESVTIRAGTAEVVNLDGNKSSHIYWAAILILMFMAIVFVVVLMVVLKTRDSNTTKDIAFAPTLSPTSYVDPSVFRTIEELYEAVDAYRMSSWNVSNQSSFESSEVASRYGYPISSWNVSLITNFSRVFDLTRFAPDVPWEFNEDLGNWDVSNAESMMGMFLNTNEFRGMGLENWNVGKVQDFSSMFLNSGLNGTITAWDTSNAENMDNMFAGAYLFNNDLSMWNVSQVRSMNSMFYNASSFQGSGLEHWNVQYVRDFSYMFWAAAKFNGNVSIWNTSSAETLCGMFADAVTFNDYLSTWDVSKVTNMITMFSSASAFTGNGIANWDVSKVTAMDEMFINAVLFDEDLSQWDVSRVSTMWSMVSMRGPVS